MTTSADTAVYFDPYDVDINANPYPVSERLPDEAGPVQPHAVVVAEGAAGGQHRPRTGVPRRPVVGLPPVGLDLSREGEIETGAVGVGVRQVRRGRKGSVYRLDRLRGLGVHLREVTPPGRDLHRVDDEAAGDQRLEGGDVVAVLEPPADELVVEPLGAGVDALLEHDVHHALDELGVAFVQREKDVSVAGLIAPVGLRGVVEAQDGRGRAAMHHSAARLDPVAE